MDNPALGVIPRERHNDCRDSLTLYDLCSAPGITGTMDPLHIYAHISIHFKPQPPMLPKGPKAQ